MKRINLLSNDISNKIAAGEVVERPSSIVKELIENSIDAEAKNITIEIENGGKNKIKIVDDGIGIYPEDIERAFISHGTSKISAIEDLYSINTLGFRGEALPSIAAISKINLKSKIKDKDFGKEIYISGGKIQYIKDVGCNTGTIVEVKDIFFNVPARQKFLKSDQREATLISNIVNRLALANHNISFKYYNNGKKSLMTFSSKDVKDSIRIIYGKNVYENLISFENHLDIFSIYGYIGNSSISRGSRNNQSIFINKRYVKSPLITTAVESAFKSFSTVNKYPFFVIFLDIYPEFIDVNVHPAKSEVKFENERMIYKFVFETVHKAIVDSIKKSFTINNEDLDLDLENNNNKTIYEKPSQLEDKEDKSILQIPIDFKNKNYDIVDVIREDITPNKNDTNSTLQEELKESIKLTNQYNNQNNDSYNISTYSNVNVMEKFPPLKIIGQFNKTYILAENCDVFYMIDQHAAHEKILFEKFKKQIEKNDVISQILAIPVVIELSSDDYQCYIENKELFKESGFLIESFGDKTINIREAPMLLGKVEIKDFFLEILDNIKNMGSGKIVEVKHKLIASLACKAAIKANHILSYSEMTSLVEDLRFIEEPYNCPHGRPTIIKVPLMDIEKKFKRIQ